MSAWFECKVKYQKMDQSGKEKIVSDFYSTLKQSSTE